MFLPSQRQQSFGVVSLFNSCYLFLVKTCYCFNMYEQVVRQNEQIKYLESLNAQHEKTISSLEEDVVQMLKVGQDQIA